MPQQYALAQGSILIDIPSEYCAAYAGRPSAERGIAGAFFRDAIMGGNGPEREELFGDLHQSELRRVLPVDSEGLADMPALVATANQVIAAYNDRENEFGLTFQSVAGGATPHCFRWVYDPELDDWILIVNYGLEVATGNASGADFNWLPLSSAQSQPGFALPAELGFMMNGGTIAVDMRYHLTLTFIAQ